jgi:hypothetical protein
MVLLFGWTFIVHPHRLAPSVDPAYYSWRIELLISQKPAALLHVTGPFGAFAGGYRVAGTVLGGYLRRIAGISLLKTTVVMIVTQWTVIALLLGGFAYRHRRDPLIFYAVTAGSGSLLLTFPFIGYADNVLCLLFLGAAIWFIAPAANDWGARLALGLLLVVAGFTHPTTLAIFCLTLLVMAALRMVASGFDLERSFQLDAPILAIAAAAIAIMYFSWRIGIWGVSQSLSEAASPPPKTRAAFLAKTLDWIKAMHPFWNGPLLAVGIIAAVLLVWRKRGSDDLSRIAIAWLIPLAGVFGYLLHLTYPYYRFFNSTLAWLLLIGLGSYLTVHYCLELARRGGIGRLALVGVLAVTLAITSNFALKFVGTGWSQARGGWLPAATKRNLDSLRTALSRPGYEGRPVAFVVDKKGPLKSGAAYGFAKKSANRSRYGMPSADIGNTYLYLGSVTRFISDQPTPSDSSTYERLSRGYLADARRGIQTSGRRPIVVVESDFNRSGTNTKFFHGGAGIPTAQNADIWFVAEGQVITPQGLIVAHRIPPAPAWHLVAVIGGLLLLLIPGVIGVRRVIFHPSLAEMLGMVPALSMALLAVAGIVVLAISRAPFSGAIPWAGLLLAIVLARALPRHRSQSPSPS